jgi:hypothetical protein
MCSVRQCIRLENKYAGQPFYSKVLLLNTYLSQNGFWEHYWVGFCYPALSPLFADRIKVHVTNMFKQRRIFTVTAALLLLSFLYFVQRPPEVSKHYNTRGALSQNKQGESPNPRIKGEKLKEDETFQTLNNLCSETKWTEGLWLHCHSYCGKNKMSACGGLNNARNRIQTCLRLAIDAGAGVVIPSVTWRNEDDLANTNFSTSCADRFFNIEHLQWSMARSCPQLKLRLCDERSGIEHVITTRERGYMQASYTKGTFRPFIETVIGIAGFNMTDISVKRSAVVSYGDTLIAWDYHASGELSTIRKALFKTIRFNQALLDTGSQIYQSAALRDRNYIGIHFRGETDWPKEWGSAAEQMELYTAELLQIRDSLSHNLKTVYVSVSVLAFEPPKIHFEPG